MAGEPKLISDGAGGIIATWYDYRFSAPHIYAQRMNHFGVAQWKPNGEKVCIAGGTTTGQLYPVIAKDDAGGAIITWEDYRNQSDGNYSDIYAHHLRSDGGPIGPPHVLSSKVTVNFGEVLLSSVKYDSVTITNVGGSSLSIDSAVTNSSEFSVTPVTATIAPDSQKIFTISFAPTSSGAKVSEAVFNDNSPGSPSHISASGVGIRFATIDVELNNGWNLVSVPVRVNDFRRSTLFPTSNSNTFAFQGGYVKQDTLVRGIGYWLKFSAPQTVALGGIEKPGDTIGISPGWNLIGSISNPLSIHQITSQPPGIITSEFFGYDGAYRAADSLMPGRGYWVKTGQVGMLNLANAGVGSSVARKIVIREAGERPPDPPDGRNSEPGLKTPDRFALEQNYPNPFNPTTEIAYQIEERSFVRLRIFNVLGELAATLVNEEQDPGRHSVKWDASQFPSGMYVYELRAAAFSGTRKLILLR
jgi:hypothetical protein